MPTQQWSSMDAAKCKQEIAQMEACDVSRVARNGNLRAAFQAGEPEEAKTVAPSSTVYEYVVAGHNLLSPPVSSPSAPINQPLFRQSAVASGQRQRLHPVPSRTFRKAESIPAHWTRKPCNAPLIAGEPERSIVPAGVPPTFMKEQLQPLSSPSDSEDTTVEPESTLIVYEDRRIHNQESRRPNWDSDSSYVPSIHMTVHKPVIQHLHRQRPWPLEEKEEEEEGKTEEEDLPFDGPCNTKYLVEHCGPSSTHPQYKESRGPSVYVVTDPPIGQPVVRKVASWVAEKLHNRADQVAGAVGLRPLRKTGSRMLLD